MSTEEEVIDIRMVEFFSGIGGMRYGIEDALTTINNSHNNNMQRNDKNYRLSSCKAYEVWVAANETYASNFEEACISSFWKKRKGHSNPEFAVYTKLIEQLRVKDLEGEGNNLWTLSPPCQPFTCQPQSLNKDSTDERCKGLKSVMELLHGIEDKPKWILLENVKGFAGSDMLKQWCSCLEDCGYSYQEFLLSPTQVGIPNHRMRYYNLAERSNRFPTPSGVIHRELPHATSSSFKHIKPISNYIETLSEEELKEYLIKDNVFDKDWANDLPIASALDTVTRCFTAGYARQLHKSTGSLLLLDDNRSQPLSQLPLDRSNMLLYKGSLRRFTPSEIAAIFGFPKSMKFPQHLSLQNKYKLIGNSVNVSVISILLQYLLHDT